MAFDGTSAPLLIKATVKTRDIRPSTRRIGGSVYDQRICRYHSIIYLIECSPLELLTRATLQSEYALSLEENLNKFEYQSTIT